MRSCEFRSGKAMTIIHSLPAESIRLRHVVAKPHEMARNNSNNSNNNKVQTKTAAPL